jgi:hypothetical protein
LNILVLSLKLSLCIEVVQDYQHIIKVKLI